MIKVELIDWKVRRPLKKASHAGLTCYQSKMPDIKTVKIINVGDRLFKPSHHTTLQHTDFTFAIDGIAVGDITFGLHLVSPFYNSDQRSGRFCAQMFLEPDYKKIEKYILNFWPKLKRSSVKKVLAYVKKGVSLYHKNIRRASEISKKQLKKERPFISEKSLEANAPKIAQEQMRMFIPVIFPTGLVFTVNTTALVALWEAAWTPAMKYVMERMVQEVLRKFPEIEIFFDKKNRRKGEWAVKIPRNADIGVRHKPKAAGVKIIAESEFVVPDPEIMHPVDKLHFMPEMMDNSVSDIRARIEISTATMGQDQRHRTVRRGTPSFTGNFYIPPLLKQMDLENSAKKLMREWFKLSALIPETLAMTLAPYGNMVSYVRKGSFNAIAHEQFKRLCWCAQEEIYHLGRLLRNAIAKKESKNSPLLKIFEPPCFKTGACAEGVRYCGRDIKLRKTGNYFPERKV